MRCGGSLHAGLHCQHFLVLIEMHDPGTDRVGPI